MMKKLLVLCAVGVLSNAQANLLTNGGFESGLTGWSCVLATADSGCGTADFGVPREGAAHFYGYENGNGLFGTNSQTFATVPGATYSLNFWYGSSYPSPFNNLSVDVGDFSDTFSFSDFQEWFSRSTTFTASAASTTIVFTFDTDGGTGTLWLDDVVIERATVPEPGTLALLGLGLAGLAATRRRKT